MAQGQKCVAVNATSCRFDLRSRKCLFKFIFSFLRYVVSLKRGVEFEEFGGKWGMTEGLNSRFPLAYPDVCGIQREANSVILIVDSIYESINLKSS